MRQRKLQWKDYYEILEVSPEAAQEDIRKARDRQALNYHPDKNPGCTGAMRKLAEEKIKNIIEAYEVIGNPQKRKEYHSEWLKKNNKPKPVVDPPYIFIENIPPKTVQYSSFIIRNEGGDYSDEIWFSDPKSWVKVVRFTSLNDSGQLPLQVDIAAEGEDWGKTYLEIIKVRLDNEETQLKIELRTQPEPTRKTDYVSTAFQTSYPSAPAQSVPRSKRSALTKLIVGLAILGLVAGITHYFWPKGSRKLSREESRIVGKYIAQKNDAAQDDGTQIAFELKSNGTALSIGLGPLGWEVIWNPRGNPPYSPSITLMFYQLNGNSMGLSYCASDGKQAIKFPLNFNSYQVDYWQRQVRDEQEILTRHPEAELINLGRISVWDDDENAICPGNVTVWNRYASKTTVLELNSIPNFSPLGWKRNYGCYGSAIFYGIINWRIRNNKVVFSEGKTTGELEIRNGILIDKKNNTEFIRQSYGPRPLPRPKSGKQIPETSSFFGRGDEIKENFLKWVKKQEFYQYGLVSVYDYKIIGDNVWLSCDLGGLNRGILYTPNKGIDWKFQFSPSIIESYIFKIDFYDVENGWATNGVSLFHTVDGGRSWSNVPCRYHFKCFGRELIRSLKISGKDDLYVGLSNGKVCHSDDGGKNWIELTDKNYMQ
jgi:hypothetical protein